MNRYIHILFFFLVLQSAAQNEVLAPLGGSAKDQYLLNSDSAAITTGFFPTTNESVGVRYVSSPDDRGWFSRKLFNEHFIEKKGKAYFLAVDPLLNISIGDERLQNSGEEFLFRNTRGAQAQGQLGEKFAFYTAFFENQARFADFRSDYFTARGEQRFNGTDYVTSNAVVPNGGRTKPFNVTGFDYASSVSYIRFKPFKQLSIHFGNNPSFIGWGHRSLLLSDNSFNFTHLKIDWQITPTLSYTVLRGKPLNLLRKQFTNFVEPPFERKGIGIHYLNYKPFKNLSIGIFESSIYLRDEATSSQALSNYFYNPLIGLNTAIIGQENGEVRNFMGVNIGLKFKKNLIYTQFVSGDLTQNQFGIQFGYRGNDLFTVKNLQLQLEYNQGSDRLYAAQNERLAYTHFNLPLAHTLGNGFEELILCTRYSWKGIYLSLQHNFYSANEMMQFKSALFESKHEVIQETAVQVNLSILEMGYVINQKTRLTVFGNGTYRQESSDVSGNINHGIIRFGIRSDLFNNYMDF